MPNDAGKEWFRSARYGLFIHYGLYSLLGRGECVMQRESIPPSKYAKLADRFTAGNFDADALARRAKQDWGMNYAVLTTKHGDGFCLYDSKLTGFTAPRTAARRDLVAEFVEACRRHGLRVGLYYALTDWSASPGPVDALERGAECYEPFIEYVHGQVREIMSNYGKIDVMWYDGWWPFDGDGWKARELNAMVRCLQPGILVNGRCGVPGDFATPEKHVSAQPGLWEACMTVNECWGYHAGDHDWKSPKAVAGMLREASAGQGNLLLNIGPKGDGSVPPECGAILDRVGQWLKANGEAIYDTERFRFDLRRRNGERADFTTHGRFTAAGEAFYLHIERWPGHELVITGLECRVREAACLETGEPLDFRQEGGTLRVVGLPADRSTEMPVVLRFRTEGPPSIYRCGGHRNPTVPHCRYDPVESDLLN